MGSHRRAPARLGSTDLFRDGSVLSEKGRDEAARGGTGVRTSSGRAPGEPVCRCSGNDRDVNDLVSVDDPPEESSRSA